MFTLYSWTIESAPTGSVPVPGPAASLSPSVPEQRGIGFANVSGGKPENLKDFSSVKNIVESVIQVPSDHSSISGVVRFWRKKGKTPSIVLKDIK